MRKPTLRQSMTIAWLIVLLTLTPVQSSFLVAQAAPATTAVSRRVEVPNSQDAGKHTASSVAGLPGGLSSDRPLKPNLVGDEAWDISFVNGVTTPGYSANVYAIAVMGSDVYVGGSFSMAGGIAANNIARWSTIAHQWYTLGGGISGIVYCMVPHGNYLYVGGSFNDISGTSAWSLARWDTVAQSWSIVGGQPGLSSSGTFVGVVQAMAFDSGGHLYVGGFFDHAGSIAAENISRWDGVAWSALGSGLGATSSDGVFALVVSGNDVYAGGYFSTPESNIAHWNGASWSGMGGMNGKVSALANIGNNLYAGG